MASTADTFASCPPHVPLCCAGWKFSGCLYFALVNLGVDLDLSLAVAMIPYCAFDVFAMLDTAHWTPLAASFLLLDGAAGGIGILAYMGVGSKKAKTG